MALMIYFQGRNGETDIENRPGHGGTREGRWGDVWRE